MINYEIISESVKHYSKYNFKQIETPWFISSIADDITRPITSTPYTVNGIQRLPGSGTFADGTTGLTMCEAEKPKWIITDMRFPNELEAVTQRNGITIRINKGTLSMVKMANEHASEIALDHITTWDYVIDNTGTILELIEKVRQILIKENII